MKKGLILLSLLLIGFSSCRVLHPNVMMKTPKNYVFATPTDSVSPEYKIEPEDIVDFRIFTNDGFKLIDLTSLNTSNAGVNVASSTIEYLVEFDGMIKLPMLKRISISGLTIRQAEFMLEEKYSLYYVKPFILLKVVNKKVFVFASGSQDAKTVPLLNDQTNVIEAIAAAGGIGLEGKAYRVKLVRGNIKNPQVFLFDLSTIEGMKNASMILQSNDIIYVEPLPKFARNAIAEIAPYLSLLSSLFIIFTYSRNLK